MGATSSSNGGVPVVVNVCVVAATVSCRAPPLNHKVSFISVALPRATSLSRRQRRYDLNRELNGSWVATTLGFGAYHTGVVVGGQEYVATAAIAAAATLHRVAKVSTHYNDITICISPPSPLTLTVAGTPFARAESLATDQRRAAVAQRSARSSPSARSMAVQPMCTASCGRCARSGLQVRTSWWERIATTSPLRSALRLVLVSFPLGSIAPRPGVRSASGRRG